MQQPITRRAALRCTLAATCAPGLALAQESAFPTVAAAAAALVKLR